MSSPKVNEKPGSRSHSARRLNNILSPSNSQEQITDEDPTTAQLVERVKSERVNNPAKQDEDRRRRTIIVEKKNGSYGFTLQSYGIHYKKEQEIEMITYVDYVEYDGPAYKAGMREGDVILSINGQDMEKADHKALVNFIKNCDSRMRMVVLFEDCVRKVELHIRYIQLQRILQSKTAELDMLCLKEREVLQGKWKSHSLPARKKASSGPHNDVLSSCQDEPYCRPTVSIEDVARVPNQSQILLAYQCLDSSYPCVIQSENSNECLIGWNRDGEESRPIILKATVDSKQNRHAGKSYQQTNGPVTVNIVKKRGDSGKSAKHFQHHTRHLCNPCMQAINNQDNTSLEAYDLASPCCDPHCVPSARMKSKQQKRKNGNHSKCHEPNPCKENIKSGAMQKGSKSRECGEEVHKTNQHKSHKYLSSLVSQFSLHSCTSSDVSQGIGENSGISYTTSLSSDTLYWDGNESRPQGKQHTYCRTSSCKSQSSCDNYQTFQPVKPKSWDNLTTKAFGGYGFGYGYMDASAPHKHQSYTSTSACLGNMTSSNTMPTKTKSQSKNNTVINLNQINFKSKTGGRVHTIQIYHNGHRRHDQSAKSNENLLLLRKSNPKLNNPSLSCECLEIGSPLTDKPAEQYLPQKSGETIYCHRNKVNQPEMKQKRGSIKQTRNVSKL